MNRDEALKRLDELTESIHEYFNEFNRLLEIKNEDKTKVSNVLASEAIIELSNKIICLVATYGKPFHDRLNYLGLYEYIPYDNPVDWYNWKLDIQEKEYPREMYWSIATRIDYELGRAKWFIERDLWESYGGKGRS
ncbi:hypothetical protein GWO43_11515 [candidate division KSB1 bacterium]|nr:hypothetical protein [candidate division KSB1 bacterium]NIR70651.1 hypothetical protein [candidate division KSB1 bacterium]NIS24581.1 hypothetical protein [candidate division KSB1 bacterium]NIT71494.1 hypothetical protein [candidate division KSB1 bacterium]NIU25190.1 hypothetical protein [candidate division KSB1 bacterium]